MKSAKAASLSAMSINQRLHDYLHGLTLQKMGVPALHLVIDDEADLLDNSLTMIDDCFEPLHSALTSISKFRELEWLFGDSDGLFFGIKLLA